MGVQKMNKYIKIQIVETGRNSLKEQPSIFNSFEKCFKNKKEAKKYLVEHYGKMPRAKTKVYRDTKDGPKEVGFTHSFWNKDVSHNSPNWFQTDWITVLEVIEDEVII